MRRSAVALLLAMVVAACGQGQHGADRTRIVEIEMRDFAFFPETLTLRAGEKVTLSFKNVGKLEHELTRKLRRRRPDMRPALRSRRRLLRRPTPPWAATMGRAISSDRSLWRDLQHEAVSDGEPSPAASPVRLSHPSSRASQNRPSARLG